MTIPSVMVDLDGTLALRGSRSPFDWKLVSEDSPNTAVITTIQALAAAGLAVVVVSGRDSSCRADSMSWLEHHLGVEFDLYMRPSGDSRPDYELKFELYNAILSRGYDIRMVFDDRDQCVTLWRSLGIATFQVAEGAF